MRKAIAVLSAVLLLALTGCNNGASPESLDESSSVPTQQSSDTESEPISSEPPESSDVSEVSDSAEDKSDTQIVTGSNGETIELRGTPREPVSEFSYEKFSERWRINIMQGSENKLVGLLDGLGKPEVKEVYIKARAILDGFYADGYAAENAAHITVNKESGFSDGYDETGFIYDSFIEEMHSIFGERVTEDILAQHPLFYEYDGRLWQTDAYPGASVYTVKYELVQNLDDVVEFNSRIYYLDDIPDYEFDAGKAETYRRRIISNRIVKTPDGWRVENCQMFSDISALPGEENVNNFDRVAE